jgi:single-strand DNA-binding protein
MAGSVNQVTLVGNLGADPDIRTFANGGRVANLRVATTETWRDRNSGERQERTDWHAVAIFAKPLVDLAEKYLRKGSKVYLQGKLETRKWQDKDGQDRWTTEVVLRPYAGEIVLLDRPNRGDERTARDDGQGRYASPRGGDGAGRGGYGARYGARDGGRDEGGRGVRDAGERGRRTRLDDDIPF